MRVLVLNLCQAFGEIGLFSEEAADVTLRLVGFFGDVVGLGADQVVLSSSLFYLFLDLSC